MVATQNSTQSFVPIREIRDGVIIREDGVLCGILLVSSINFSLKSIDEQTAILSQFQNMLNSLEVSAQIVIQSRRLNIRPYVQYLEEIYEKQPIELLKLQTREYINFIKEYTDLHKIMAKKFFVVATYSPLKTEIKNFSISLFSKKKKTDVLDFEENNLQLQQRLSFIQSNIGGMGLKSIQLGTEEVVEVLYKTFNPGDNQTPPSEQNNYGAI